MRTTHTVAWASISVAQARRVARHLIPAAALAFTVACTGSSSSADERVLHGDGEGPLQVMAGDGMLSINAPEDQEVWSGSFGAITLCARETDRTLQLQRVRVDTADTQPHEVRVFLRTVPPAGDATATAVPGSSDPFLSTLGRPPHFADNPFGDRYGGDYTTDLAGIEVTQSCDPRPGPESGYQELVFTLAVGLQGGEVRRAWVDYTADGKPYASRVKWRMVACGDSYPARVCRPK